MHYKDSNDIYEQNRVNCHFIDEYDSINHHYEAKLVDYRVNERPPTSYLEIKRLIHVSTSLLILLLVQFTQIAFEEYDKAKELNDTQNCTE